MPRARSAAGCARARRSKRKWPRRASNIISVKACTHPATVKRDRDPDMRERAHQGKRHAEIHRHRADRDLDRRARVLAGEEGRGQHLDEDEGRQARRVGGERRRGRRGGLGRRTRRAETAPRGSAGPGSRGRSPRAGSAGPTARRRGSASSIAPARSPPCTWRDSGGRIAVATAMPTTPSGSWFSRSA